jgi:hypothetical protein
MEEDLEKEEGRNALSQPSPKTLVSGTFKVPVSPGEESATYRSRHERVLGTARMSRPCRATHLAIRAWMLFSRETVSQSLQTWTIH